MSGSREAQLDGSRSALERSCARNGRPIRDWKGPRAIWQADASAGLRKQPALLVWGPGAGVEAAGRLWSGHNRPGVASIPQSCRQVARALATRSRVARLTSQLRSPRGRREMCGNRWESAKAYLLLSYRKFTLVTGRRDGCGSLGQVEGAQGVLVQPEWTRGCRHTKSAAALRRRRILTWRGSYDVRVAARLKETDQELTLENRRTRNWKGPRVIWISWCPHPSRESVLLTRLVWGPGAGVEAAGGLCLSRNEAGVVCRP